jgi:phosphoribosylaminoimidazolecarboxamide formyltransferase/IMP cyclohydrolase
LVFLNRQDNESDVQQMKEFDIPQIDLVIVDLYPLKVPGADES